MRCFICLCNFNDPENLFNHLKDQHGICGNSDFRCSLCPNEFDNFGGFKKHTRICFEKNNERNHQAEQPQHVGSIDEAFEILNELDMEFCDEITDFKEFVQKRSLEMVLDMSANMSIPRNLVFKTISNFQKFITETYIHGLKTIIAPLVGPEEGTTVKRFIKSLEAPFNKFDTETKLDSVLFKADLMQPIEEWLLKEEPIKDPLDDPLKDLKLPSDIEDKNEESTMIIMPIGFMLKKFFELPNVYKKIETHTKQIRESQKLNHFINGKLWKKKLENFDSEQTVIPYFLYVDGAQTNNPLGPHCCKGMLDLNYITLPSIPTEYQSKLENIFVASVSPNNKPFGIEGVFNNVIEVLTKLANDGIVLTIDGEDKQVFFVCGAFTGDNKEANAYLGFVRQFKHPHYCRYCRMHRSQMQLQSIEIPEERRSRLNYEEDLITNDPSRTGIMEYSCFNEIPFFHVTDSSAEDSTHIVDEGIIQYCVLPSLYYFIFVRKYFTLNELNRRIKLFDYCEDEKQNIPRKILETTLKDKAKLKMTASEIANFMHNLIFIIGDLIEDEDDDVWKFLLTTIKFFDLAYLPCYSEEDITELSNTIALMNNTYQEISNATLKPVQHFAIHYPGDTSNFGPLRYLRTIRCEGRHKPIKSYTKNTSNRLNICFSIGKKELYNFAQRLSQSRGLEDTITAAKICDITSIASKVYYRKLEPSAYKESLTDHVCSFTTKVVINGMVFKWGMWLPVAIDSSNREVSQIMQICDIVLLLQNETITELFAVCKTYRATNADNNICHIVDMSSVQNQYCIINIREYLSFHHYPVKLHTLKGELMFRCKRF